AGRAVPGQPGGRPGDARPLRRVARALPPGRPARGGAPQPGRALRGAQGRRARAARVRDVRIVGLGRIRSRARVISGRRIPAMSRHWWLALALVFATLCAYGPLSSNGFIRLDDPEYVTQNPHVIPGFTSEGFLWS